MIKSYLVNMIKINELHLEKFIKARCEYLYPISNGIYLAFDEDTLEYIGIELFYLPRTMSYEKQADNLLNRLIGKDILTTL